MGIIIRKIIINTYIKIIMIIMEKIVKRIDHLKIINNMILILDVITLIDNVIIKLDVIMMIKMMDRKKKIEDQVLKIIIKTKMDMSELYFPMHLNYLHQKY